MYDPVVGRFVSSDSMIPNWYDPQALGRYTYARNNPLKYTDPDGHSFVLAVLVGAALAYITDALLTPDIANAPEDVSTPLESTSAVEHGGSLLTGASIGVTAVAGGLKAAGTEVLEEVVDEATGGLTNVSKVAKNAPKTTSRVKKLGPDPKASGPHTAFKRDPNTGRVTGYTEFDAQGNPVKRFRGTGREHGGQKPPLVLEPKANKGPGSPPKVPRPAKPEELPKGY